MNQEQIKMKIEGSFFPKPSELKVWYEPEYQTFRALIKQDLEGQSFLYINEFDLEGNCLAELELTPKLRKVLKEVL